MKYMNRFLIVSTFSLLMLAAEAFGSTANVSITQSGTAVGNCTTNVQTPAFFNSAANWGSGASQIGPGTTILICGTFTGAAGATEFQFNGSGASGSPITLLFDSGAILTAPYWSSNGAISCSGKQYIVIDGGTNGLIQNTANGTSLTYHQSSFGVNGQNCPHTTVKNLTVQNIYINQGSSSSATDTAGLYTADINFAGSSTGVTITGNTVSSAKIGISVSADPNADASNVTVSNNTISDMDWGITVSGGDSGDTMTNVLISGNTITNWANWQFPTNTYHQDGVIVYNQGSTNIETVTFTNNYIYGDLGVGSPTGFIYCSTSTSCQFYNNVLVNTGHAIYGIVWINNPNCGNHLYNNTIVGLSGDFGLTIGNLTCPQSLGTMVVENNIFSGPNVGINDYGSLTADMSVSNYNVFRNAAGSAPSMSTNDGTYLTWATWKGNGFDANSNSNTPNLNGSYRIASASGGAYQTGTNLTSLGLTALNTDKAGIARPTSGAWDIGAYEFTTSVPAPSGLTGTVVP